jgi:hypothetical protein
MQTRRLRFFNWRLLAAALMLSSFSHSFGQLTNGLLNYWNFEGDYKDTAGSFAGSASTFADDGTANSEDAVKIEADGQFGKYGKFAGDAGEAFVEVPDSEDILRVGKSVTISAWFRTPAFTRSWQALIAHGEGSDYRVARNGDGQTMAYAGGTGDIGGGAVASDGAWHHLVAISEHGVSTRLWIDGSLAATGGAPNISNNGAGRLLIGGNPNDAGGAYRSWAGDIDDVGMWSRPLTPAEIGLIYDSGKAATPAALGKLLLPGDADGDGLQDSWEIAYGLNPNSAAGKDGATGDPDNDGADNLKEFQTKTNPIIADTDGDGLSDGAEINTHTPNPLVPDTDGDTLSDGAEINTLTTDPKKADTDGDSYKDGVEIDILKSNPKLASDPSGPIPLLQPRFTPIVAAVAGKPWTTGGAGWNYQQNFYAGGVIFNNQARNNYIVHSTGTPAPLTSATFVSPFIDHGAGGVLTNNTDFLSGTGENFTVRATGYVKFTQPGDYEFHHGADDTTYTVMDTLDGQVVAQNGCCGDFVTKFTIAPGHTGTFPLDFVFGEQGGGDWMDLGISGPGITGTVPLGDTANGSPAVFTVVPNLGPDPDGDGLPSEWETTYGLNPNNATGVNGASGDPDNDTLTNLQEYTQGTIPNKADSDDDGEKDGDELTAGTNPVKADTDSDGLKDGEEKTKGTDPKLADTDGDGLLDGEEVNTYKSDPLKVDTDGDTVNDSCEASGGTNPLVADVVGDELKFGLAAYWPMDDSFNSAVGGVTATAQGTAAVTRVPGKFGNALRLDGVDQYLVVDGSENKWDFIDSSMSVSAWFTADQVSRSWQALMGKGDAGNNWRIHTRGGDTPAELSFSGGAGDIPKHSTPLTIGGNFYHHVVAVAEKDVSTRLYLDGVLVSTGGAPVLGDAANPLRIGDNAGATGRFWNGKIDDLGIWCRALTENDIARIYNGGTGKTIASLLTAPPPAASIKFTNVVYDKATDQFTLTWASEPGKTYTVNASATLGSWPLTVNANVASGGTSTTFGPFANPTPGALKMFLRAKEN